jgi:hypothetical protein
MSFPTNPIDGQIYNIYSYSSSNDSWERYKSIPTKGLIKAWDLQTFTSSGLRIIDHQATKYNCDVFSLCMWVYCGSTQPQYADIIDNSHASYSWSIEQNSNTLNQYSFLNATGLFQLSTGVWQHLVCIKNGTTGSVYID